MKLLSTAAWFAALKAWRAPRRAGPDPADMGTAFGLDSITIIDFDPSDLQSETAAAAPRWQRRLARRSRF